MSCERYQDGLIDLALGGEDTEARAHVASCAACAARLREEQRYAAQLDSALAVALEVEPAAGFESRLRRGVQARAARRRSTMWVGLAAGVAAALAVAVLVPRLTRGPRREEARHPPATVRTPVAQRTPTAGPPEPAAIVPRRRQASTPPVEERRPAAPRVETEPLVAADDAAALRRLQARLQQAQAESAWTADLDRLPDDFARPFEPARVIAVDALPSLNATEAPLLEELPRIEVVSISGGGV